MIFFRKKHKWKVIGPLPSDSGVEGQLRFSGSNHPPRMLYQMKDQKQYMVTRVETTPEIAARLSAFGVVQGAVLRVLQVRKKGACIIQIRGSRLALGHRVCTGIWVCERRMS